MHFISMYWFGYCVVVFVFAMGFEIVSAAAVNCNSSVGIDREKVDPWFLVRDARTSVLPLLIITFAKFPLTNNKYNDDFGQKGGEIQKKTNTQIQTPTQT